MELLDCVVIGAGPAGLQAGYWLKAAGRHFVILERAEGAGSFFERYPRVRSLISFNKSASIHTDPETNLRWDWNSLLTSSGAFSFRDFSTRLYPEADEMLVYLRAFAERFELPIEYRAEVLGLERGADGVLRVRLAGGEVLSCRYVLVATGLGLPNVPDVPGIGCAEGYEDVSLDARSFAGQTVLIIGKGNSGLEIADRLLETAAIIHMASPSPVRMAWRTRHPGHLRSHYARLLDMYQLKMLHSVLDCTVRGITRADGKLRVEVTYSHADGEHDVLVYDRVIRCAGFRFDPSVFGGMGPALGHGGRLPEMTATWESTSLPGVYYAGTLMQARDYRRAGSAFIDGFRYNIRTLHRLLEERFHGRAYPRVEVASDAGCVADHVLRRASTTSALWVQFRHLCDVAVVDSRRGVATVYAELPVEHALARFGEEESVLTLGFEWGDWAGDVFAIDRHPSHELASASMFLHPVVRHYRRGVAAGEHHVLEDLVGAYHPDHARPLIASHSGMPVRLYHERQHVAPLRAFLAGCGLPVGG